MRPRRFGGKKVIRAAQLRLERLEDRNAPSDSLSSLSAPFSKWDVTLEESGARYDDSPQVHSSAFDRWQSVGDDSIALSYSEPIQTLAPPISLSPSPISISTNETPHGIDLANVSLPSGV